MKNLLLFLFILISMLSQAQNYPAIDKSISYYRYDFEEIDELIEEQQPNKAISKLLVVQMIAFNSENLYDLSQVYTRLQTLIPNSGKEEEDIEKLFFEQHNLFLKAKGISRNFSAMYMHALVQEYRIRQSFGSGDESLKWNIKDSTVRLQLGEYYVDYSPLENFYFVEMKRNREQLMKISADLIFDSADVVLQPTLFDVLTHEMIERSKGYGDNNDCYWQSTEEFEKMDLPEIRRWQAELEVLNKKYRRWDAYAANVEMRIEMCNDPDVKERAKVFERFQNELRAVPASNRFALRRAKHYSEMASRVRWTSSQENANGFVDALEIINSALKKHPISDFTDDLLALKKDIETGSLTFHLKHSKNIPENKIMTVDYRNLKTAQFNVYKVVRRKPSFDSEKNPLQKYDLKLLSKRNLDFPEDTRMLSHTKDFILSDFSEAGTYLLISGPNQKIIEECMKAKEWNTEPDIHFQMIVLSNLAVRTVPEKDVHLFIVNDFTSGKPIKSASVQIFDNLQLVQSGKTDDVGMLRLSSPNNGFQYVVKHNDDSISSSGWNNNRGELNEVQYKVFTDRSIYRPGQTVHFKAIGFTEGENERKFEIGKMLNIRFNMNYDGPEIYTDKLKTDQFGSVSGSFVLPKKDIELGSLSITINDQNIHSIQIEEYKRPTFEVSFEKPKGTVSLGKPFTMRGKVMAYAGYPISNADVTISVYENRYFPFHCIVLDEWREFDTTIQVRTDANGFFEFVYSSDKPKDAFGIYYQFTATALDLSGEVQTANEYLYLGKTTYEVAIQHAARYQVGKQNELEITVYNSQYEVQKGVDIQYSLQRDESDTWYSEDYIASEFKDFTDKEFQNKFPSIDFYGESRDSYKEIKKGSIKSEGKISLAGLSAGNYKITAQVIDELGDTVLRDEHFIVWDPKSKKNQHLAGFWSEKMNAETNATGPNTLVFGSSHSKVPMLVMTYGEKGFVSAEYYKLRKRKNLDFTLNEKTKKGLKVYASVIKNGSIEEESIHLIPVDTSDQLRLKLKKISEPLLPGSNLSWEMEISQNGPSTSSIELLASMYDASLDAFASHYWSTQLLRPFHIDFNCQTASINQLLDQRTSWRTPYFYDNGSPYALRIVGCPDCIPRTTSVYNKEFSSLEEGTYEGDGVVMAVYDANTGGALTEWSDEEAPAAERQDANTEAPKSIRENFNETAFFEPKIHVSPDGKYKWTFTLPDALTKWKMMAFAHTPDFKSGYLEQSFEARQDLMLETFEPRFWRKGDSLYWIGKVVNLSDKEQNVKVNLKIEDLVDLSDVSNQFGNFLEQSFVLQASESKAVEWAIAIADSCPNFVRFEASAATANFTDVIRKNIPILEGKERITLAQNYTIDKASTHTIQIDDAGKISREAKILTFSVTVQKQPLWSTMLSLTSLMRPINELNDSYFSQYFAAELARKILVDHPDMRQALSSWSVLSEDALTSLLEQNEELKALALSETPWLMDAKNETEQLRRLSQLLNENELNSLIKSSWSKLKEMQLGDGSWSWVGKDRACYYITQRIAIGLTDLKEYGIAIDEDVLDMCISALDTEYMRRYSLLDQREKMQELGLGVEEIEWLYMRAVLKAEENDAATYFAKLIPKKWTKFNLCTQSDIGNWALLVKDENLAKKVMASFQDRAQSKKDLGKYWVTNRNGYGWYEDKIITQARIMSFYQNYGDMKESVSAMQKWLLQQKRTQMWDTPRSTAYACYALKDFGANNANSEVRLRFKSESDTYYDIGVTGEPFFKKSPAKGDLSAVQKGASLTTNSDALIFASAQVVYTDKAKNIEKSTGDFRTERTYYVMEKGQEIPVTENRLMQVGDIVRVKIKLVSNRDLDFVHLEDPKASGWEPLEALSGYRYENGLYYLSNRDNKTDFFIENLRKGTYVYQYDVKVTMRGKLQVGPAKAICYYAPSFSANTAGHVFEIK